KRRIESSDGISYTEFSYLLLQAYDYLVLHDRFNCTLQMGGSDQWGNITAGMDLIRRFRGGRAHGLVLPLITTASGAKFGKTELGAVWLDATRTSPFRFYQFWFNTDDREVGHFLRYFTFLDRPTIDALEEAVKESPEKREAQRVLAREVTVLVHGGEQADRAARASSLLFGEEIATLAVEEVLAVFDDVPSTDIVASEFSGEGVAVVDLLTRVQLATSKGEARRLVQSGGIYVNNRRLSDLHTRLRASHAIEGRLFVLRKGQRQQCLVKLV
ncbi:MAG: tyrosine--tRNA ligase, partial [Vicinamibacterales bacterium]